jgi:Ni,Fe-hydrogenase III large subunit
MNGSKYSCLILHVGVEDERRRLKAPFKIVFSLSSSDKTNRNIDFSREIDCIKKNFDETEVVVEEYTFKFHTVKEQMEMVSQASILITGCGGGAVTATFLPKGASVFLYYVQDGGATNNVKTKTPARLDWDIFNNLAYLRVHWIPRYIHIVEECDILVTMIRQELKLIREENQEL